MPAPLRDKYGNTPKEGDWVGLSLSSPFISGQIIKVLDSGLSLNVDPKAIPTAVVVVAVQFNIPLNGQPMDGLVLVRGPQNPVNVGGQPS